jgi:serine O-acetyltransferase
MTGPEVLGPEMLRSRSVGAHDRSQRMPCARGQGPRLIASRDCLTAQRAALALVLCGRPAKPVVGTHTELRLADPFRQDLIQREPLAMLAALDALCPGTLFSTDPELRAGQQGLIGHAADADARLAEVTKARNHRDLDIAIHLLRDVMLRIERSFDNRGAAPVLDARDAVIAPLIWRMMLLDRHYRTYLCLGLDRSMALAGRMLDLPGADVVLDDLAAGEFLDQLSPEAVIRLPEDMRPDWAPALGPAGRPQYPSIRPRRKNPILTVRKSSDPVSQPNPPNSDDGQLDVIAEKLRLIRITSQQRRYPGRTTPRLPSRSVVIRLLSNVVGALYPRHFGPAGLNAQTADIFVAQTLRTIRQRLTEQLELEWLLQPDAEQLPCRRRARTAADAFMAGLPQIRDLHDTDINAAFQGDPSAKSLDEIVLCFPGIAAILRHRIAHSLYKLGAPMLARIMAEHSHSLSGIDIHPGAKIGPACFIDHGTGVVIGETAVIGRNVRIYQQVTLGAKRFESDGEGGLVKGQPRHPLVGDDVVIYAGANILGRIEIGKGAVIGGGVWLTDSVPPGAVVTQAKPSLNT